MVIFDSWSLITEENVCDKSPIECCGNTPVAGVFITFCNVVGPGIVAAFGVPDDAVYDTFEFSKFFRKNINLIASVIPDPDTVSFLLIADLWMNSSQAIFRM